MIRRAALATVVAALAAATLAPHAASARVETGAERRVEAVHKTVTVHIRDNTFNPTGLNVAEGTTVRWINDGREHGAANHLVGAS